MSPLSFFREIRSNFSFLFHFSMKIKIATRIAPDVTPRFAASHLGYSVCLCPIKWTLDLYGLMSLRRSFHYANMSVQYTAIFHGCKNDKFQMNILIFFLFLLKT